MRIALVVSGGFDRSQRERVTPALLWLVERLSKRHQIVVYVLRYHAQPCSYPLLGATIRDLGSPRGPLRQYSALVAAMRRDGPFDIVHGYLGLPSGLMSALAGRRLGVPSLVTLDSGELVAIRDVGDGGYGLQLRRRHRWALAVALRLATRLTVCSLYQEQLARSHGLSPEVIPIGVDTRLFAPVADGLAGAQSQNRPHPPWRLLHVASLNPVKDQTTLLEALALVPGAHLDLVGEDTVGGSMVQLAGQLGIEARVTFHGFQSSTALVGFYQRAHLFVLSSRHEAANVAVLEAAACGVPTVGTHVGYLAEWSPERAVTVAPHNARALAEAVSALLADPPRRLRLASAAREWTLAHDADWTAEQFMRLYEQLAERRIRTEKTFQK